MDEDTAQAAWHQVETENWQRWEQEQRRLQSDPAFELWLNELEHEHG